MILGIILFFIIHIEREYIKRPLHMGDKQSHCFEMSGDTSSETVERIGYQMIEVLLHLSYDISAATENN